MPTNSSTDVLRVIDVTILAQKLPYENESKTNFYNYTQYLVLGGLPIKLTASSQQLTA